MENATSEGGCVDHGNCQNGTKGLKVSTFVFLDFEATGLTRPRITELCLLAVNRIDLCSNTSPRVTNKLVLCVDPKRPIDKDASYLTGLYNDSLEYQKPWSEDTVNLITSFLSHLTGPICLVAHNGNGFDFPLLLSELQRVNKTLSESIYCADSLEGFRELDGLTRKYVRQNNGINTPTSSYTPPSKLAQASVPPAVKRKSADNLAVCNAKLTKPDTSGGDSSTAHVRKRLDFGKTEVADVNEHAESHDHASQFSESLEDSDYIMALDQVEKELEANKNNDCECAANEKDSALENNSSNGEDKTGTDNGDAKEKDSALENKSNGEDKLSQDNDNFAAKLDHSAVEAGSGYLVRGKDRTPENPDKLQDETNVNNFAASSENKLTNSSNGTDKPDTDKSVPVIAVTVTPNPKQSITPVASTSNSPALAASNPSTPRKSYKLGEIYFRTFGARPALAHNAEADCIMLMKISTKAPAFLEWVDKNAVLLSSLQAS